MMRDLFTNPLPSWLSDNGKDDNIVLSSRVRLARDLEKIPFPNIAQKEQLFEVKKKVIEAGKNLNYATYEIVELDELKALERNVLVEKHLISTNHIKNPENRAVLVRNDDAVSIMVNEEDHLRIQAMAQGLDLKTAYVVASEVDDLLEKSLDISFNEHIGYLTACPTNLGTGLRASVMVHLPGLVSTKQINQIINAAPQLGLAVRGLYGEGTEAKGNIFQISNQLTLGFKEEEIIDNLTSATKEIINHEQVARARLHKSSKENLNDEIWRAFGILRYAQVLTADEALALASKVQVGIDLGIIDIAPKNFFNELMVISRPNYLYKIIGEECFKINDINLYRAQVIREKLKKC